MGQTQQLQINNRAIPITLLVIQLVDIQLVGVIPYSIVMAGFCMVFYVLYGTAITTHHPTR